MLLFYYEMAHKSKSITKSTQILFYLFIKTRTQAPTLYVKNKRQIKPAIHTSLYTCIKMYGVLNLKYKAS